MSVSLKGMCVDPLVRDSARTRNLGKNVFFFLEPNATKDVSIASISATTYIKDHDGSTSPHTTTEDDVAGHRSLLYYVLRAGGIRTLAGPRIHFISFQRPERVFGAIRTHRLLKGTTLLRTTPGAGTDSTGAHNGWRHRSQACSLPRVEQVRQSTCPSAARRLRMLFFSFGTLRPPGLGTPRN